MSIRQLSAIFLAAFLLIAVAGWLFVSKARAQERTSDPWERGGPHKVIDASARAVTSDNEASVRALTDEVFNYPHAYGRIPDSVASIIKDRLANAEIAHIRGMRPGIKEAEVANVVNMVADHLHLPEYAKTTVKQVRVLRMSLALASPIFMGRGMTEQNVDVGESINPELSPLQATHLAAVMLDQKFLDPDYQVTASEWEQGFQQKQIEKLKRQQALAKSNDPTKFKYMIGSTQNPKRTEMRQAFNNGVSALGTADALDIMDSAFASFGMKPN